MSAEPVPRQEAETRLLGSAAPDRRAAQGHSIGSIIADKYRLDRLLGEGGMGTVWHATNLQLESPVAIKLLRAGLPSQELAQRLRSEARAAARLVHPSIVRVFDIGEWAPGEPFIVMEMLAGESLSDRVYRSRPSPAQAVQVLLPIAEALSLAHSSRVVHRDLKPDNIFLVPEGEFFRPKLLDFGIAKVLGGASMSLITQRGVLVGSPAYMSPEQARGEGDIDFRSDIWSFCVVLYEMVSGRLPFGNIEGAALLRAIVQDEPRPLTGVQGVDAELWSLIRQGLSKDPKARPSSMFELGRELATWLRRQKVNMDVTGAALEPKWLARQVRIMTGTSWKFARADERASTFDPVAPQDEDHEPISLPFGSRKSRIVPLVAVAAVCALVGGIVAWTQSGTDADEASSVVAAVTSLLRVPGKTEPVPPPRSETPTAAAKAAPPEPVEPARPAEPAPTTPATAESAPSAVAAPSAPVPEVAAPKAAPVPHAPRVVRAPVRPAPPAPKPAPAPPLNLASSPWPAREVPAPALPPPPKPAPAPKPEPPSDLMVPY